MRLVPSLNTFNDVELKKWNDITFETLLKLVNITEQHQRRKGVELSETLDCAGNEWSLSRKECEGMDRYEEERRNEL